MSWRPTEESIDPHELQVAAQFAMLKNVYFQMV